MWSELIVNLFTQKIDIGDTVGISVKRSIYLSIALTVENFHAEWHKPQIIRC